MKTKFYKSCYVWSRVRKLPEMATMEEVVSALECNYKTVWLWTKDSFCRKFKAAVKKDGAWYWDRDRLLIWMYAIGSGKPPTDYPGKVKRRSNPPMKAMSKESARKLIGMPLDYAMSERREA